MEIEQKTIELVFKPLKQNVDMDMTDQDNNFSFSDILKSASEMKEKLQKTQEKLKTITTTAESGGGMVTVTVNGHGDILDIKLDPSIVDPEDIGMLQDLILAALNAAMKKSREMSKEKMQGEMFGLSNMLNLPGMFGPK